MATHLYAFREIATQIENLSSDDGMSQIQGLDLVSTLSLSLPDSYEPLVMTLQSRSEPLTFDFMAARLLQESTCCQVAMATNGSSTTGGNSSAFIAGGFGRFGVPGGGYRGGKYLRAIRFGGRGRQSFGAPDIGHLGGNTAGPGAGQARRIPGKCHYFQRKGHWEGECLERRADEAAGRHKNDRNGTQAAFTAFSGETSMDDD